MSNSQTVFVLMAYVKEPFYSIPVKTVKIVSTNAVDTSVKGSPDIICIH